MTQPVRRCAGCGRRAPQHDLVRFAVRDGELVAGRGHTGRGVYTCRSRACFERASAQRGFARALRQAVHVDPSLARIYTGESHA